MPWDLFYTPYTLFQLIASTEITVITNYSTLLYSCNNNIKTESINMRIYPMHLWQTVIWHKTQQAANTWIYCKRKRKRKLFSIRHVRAIPLSYRFSPLNITFWSFWHETCSTFSRAKNLSLFVFIQLVAKSVVMCFE